MKKLFLFLVIPFFTMMGSERHTGEFVITLTNYGSSWDVTFTATAVSEKWDGDYHLTSSYSNPSVRLNGQQTVPPHTPTAYFDLVIDPNAGENPTMALGKNKITASVNGNEKAHFYMDWRTSDYGVSPDVYFKYDVNNERFINSSDTQTIDGTTQTVWNLVSGIDKVTSGLELYLDVSEQNDHPNLSWNAYHDSNILGYNIYKKVTLDGGSSSTFTIFTTSTSYLDDDFEIDPKFGDDQVLIPKRCYYYDKM